MKVESHFFGAAAQPLMGGVANNEHRRIGVWGMVVVGFFWVHGGIYGAAAGLERMAWHATDPHARRAAGNEALVAAAPPVYVFTLLAIVPFVYSLPIALIVAELSTAWPEDGGYVVWVQAACGRLVGAHHGFWVWVIYVVDAAVYPVLLSEYLDKMVALSRFAKGCTAMFVVVGVTIINMNGVDVMVKFSTLLAVVSLAPTLVFMVIGLPQLRPEVMFHTEGDVDWSLLVSWTLWLYCGFFSLGTLAGELKNPSRTFLISIAVLFPAVLVLNTLPLLVALSYDDEISHYKEGYFNVIAGKVAGNWLAFSFQIGANVCLVGLYNAAIVTAERSLAWLVEHHGPAALTPPTDGGMVAPASPGRTQDRPLVDWLLTSRNGVAPVYQLGNAALACILVWLPYDFLVEFSMLISVPSICLFMWSFVKLRYSDPGKERPFAVPGGKAAAITITLFPVSVSVAYFLVIFHKAFYHRRQHDRTEAWNQIISMCLVVGTGIAGHWLRRALHTRRRKGGKKYTEHISSDTVELQHSDHEADPAEDSGRLDSTEPMPRKVFWSWLHPSSNIPRQVLSNWAVIHNDRAEGNAQRKSPLLPHETQEEAMEPDADDAPPNGAGDGAAPLVVSEVEPVGSTPVTGQHVGEEDVLALSAAAPSTETSMASSAPRSS